MIRRLLGAVTFSGVTLAALAAFGAEHAEHAHEPDYSLLALHAFGLLVLGGILVYFAREPLQTFMRDRSDGIRRQLEAARTALERSEAANAAIRARLGRIAEENENMVRQAAELAERERARALERAQGAAERVREEARRTADQEIERARAELQNEAAELAVSLAGELVRQNLTPDDERRLRSEFVTRIGQAS
ncbi:MAG TPA: ATP synthase F0 subunit B [Myxococcota bacterium]|nr:ATP synthase F0 subunit B [Myxococcota bacterium]